MDITLRIRLQDHALSEAKDLAATKDISMSALVREAMAPYLRGEKRLNRKTEPIIKATTVLCPAEDAQRLKEIAAEANVSVDEAIRTLVQDYLREQSHTTQAT